MTPSTNSTDPLDRKSFSILVRDHHPKLMVYARALVFDDATAADLVQDAFVAAWKNLGRFDVTRDFGTWMRGIVRNKWRDHCRKQGRNPECGEAELEVMETQVLAWEAQTQRSGLSVFDRLEDCLKQLPDALDGAVRAFYYDDLDGEEAATRLEINPATLRKRLERARDGLRDCLDEKTAQHA